MSRATSRPTGHRMRCTAAPSTRRGSAHPLRPGTARLALAAALLAAGATGCGEQREPLLAPADRPTSTPRASVAAASTPGLALVFLSPLGTARTFVGTFDGTRAPVVEVCRVPSTTAACAGAPVARYTLAEGTGGATLVVDPAAQLYRVDWRTVGLPAGQGYRIRVLLGGAELGRAHARVPAAGETATQVQQGGWVPLGNGSRLPIRFRLDTSTSYLPGAPDAPAATALPRRDYRPAASDFDTGHPQLAGAWLSPRLVMLVPRPGTTVAAVNALVAELGATLGAALPGHARGGNGLLVLRLPTTTHAAMEAALARLRADARVLAAAPDLLLSPQLVPRAASGMADGSWDWELVPAGGNWGLEAVRAPQLWNLNPALAKRMTKESRVGTLAGVLDVGFPTAHADLPYELNMTPGRVDDHGAHVAGIIGARFDNGAGTDGIDPFARLAVRTPSFELGGDPAAHAQRASFWELMLFGLENLLRARPALGVVNLSLGYNWGRARIPDTDPQLQPVVRAQAALFVEILRALQAEYGRLPVFVTAAGNDSHLGMGLQQAQWASAMNHAALALGAAPIIVVEALENAGGGVLQRAPYSNVGGHLFAPGSDVLSAYASGYGRMSGTSMAAPHVAGVVSYLLAIRPSLGAATLTSNPVRDLLVASGQPVPRATTRRLDAWGAALQLDVGSGDLGVLRMLLDVDDGSIDGNRRTKPDGSDEAGEDLEGDLGVGDGRVDMSDFRRWRDWLLAAERTAGLALDGSPRHPKKDVNGNGRWSADGDDENVHPRGDFNGDGQLSRTATRAVPGAAGGAVMTDLAVLQGLYEDPDVPGSALPTLLHSGDIEVDARGCLADAATVRVQARVYLKGGARPATGRMLDRATPVRVFTVPVVAGREYTLFVEELDAAGATRRWMARDYTVRPGSDAAFACARVTVTPEQVTLAPGTTQRFTARVDHPRDATVSWRASGGTVGADGLYTAPSAEGSYVVVARSRADTLVEDTAHVTVRAAGLARVRLLYNRTRAQTGAAYTDDQGVHELRDSAGPAAPALPSVSASAASAGQGRRNHYYKEYDWTAWVEGSVSASASASSGVLAANDGWVRSFTANGTLRVASDLNTNSQHWMPGATYSASGMASVSIGLALQEPTAVILSGCGATPIINEATWTSALSGASSTATCGGTHRVVLSAGSWAFTLALHDLVPHLTNYYTWGDPQLYEHQFAYTVRFEVPTAEELANPRTSTSSVAVPGSPAVSVRPLPRS